MQVKKPAMSEDEIALRNNVMGMISSAPALEQLAASRGMTGLAGAIAGMRWALNVLAGERWPSLLAPQKKPATPQKKEKPATP